MGRATTRGTGEDAMDLLRQAVVLKKGKASGTILLLDAGQISVLLSRRIFPRGIVQSMAMRSRNSGWLRLGS